MEAQNASMDATNFKDISDSNGRFAVVVEGQIERRFAFRGNAEEYVAELDQHHTHGEIVNTA